MLIQTTTKKQLCVVGHETPSLLHFLFTIPHLFTSRTALRYTALHPPILSHEGAIIIELYAQVSPISLFFQSYNLHNSTMHSVWG